MSLAARTFLFPDHVRPCHPRVPMFLPAALQDASSIRALPLMCTNAATVLQPNLSAEYDEAKLQGCSLLDHAPYSISELEKSEARWQQMQSLTMNVEESALPSRQVEEELSSGSKVQGEARRRRARRQPRQNTSAHARAIYCDAPDERCLRNCLTEASLLGFLGALLQSLFSAAPSTLSRSPSAQPPPVGLAAFYPAERARWHVYLPRCLPHWELSETNYCERSQTA